MESSEPRLIIHLDMDCFYVSVERFLDPDLEGKPVAVGGSAAGRGVVASCSYEARKFGVRSAMPMGQALRLCPELLVVSRGFSEYGEYSRRVREVLEEFTPLVQMASQDEAYMDLTGTTRLWGPPLAAAQSIHDRVVQATGLPCSLGISTNKLVSKIASGLSKPHGLLYIPAGSEEAFMRPLSIRRLPGLGPKTQERLKEINIQTLGQIAAMEPKRLERLFGNQAAGMAERARGRSDSPVIVDEEAKSISAEETFMKDSVDVEFLEGILGNLCEKVAYRLRKNNCRSRTVTLKFRYHDFETHTASQSLTCPTDDEAELLRIARELLHSRRQPSRPIRLLGVGAGNLLFDGYQADFLEAEKNERLERLHQAVDRVRDKHGYGSVKRGSSGGRAEETNEKRWG